MNLKEFNQHAVVDPSTIAVVDELDIAPRQCLTPGALETLDHVTTRQQQQHRNKITRVVWRMTWKGWSTCLETFMSILQECTRALARVRVEQVVLCNSQDAFPIHNDRLQGCFKDIAMIPTKTMEMHGAAFGPCSAALGGVCDAITMMPARRPSLTTIVWSPWAANATDGALSLAKTLIDCHFSGCLHFESRLDPIAWQAVQRLLVMGQLSEFHVRADMHSSTPPDPNALVHAMLLNDTSLQTLHLQGLAMGWLFAAAFPVDVPGILQRNRMLAHARRLDPSPAVLGQALVHLSQQKPLVSACAMFWLLQNNRSWGRVTWKSALERNVSKVKQ